MVRLRKAKKRPSGEVPPLEVKAGETYLYNGVRLRCVSKPFLAPDRNYTYIPTSKWGLRQRISVPTTETVGVFRT